MNSTQHHLQSKTEYHQTRGEFFSQRMRMQHMNSCKSFHPHPRRPKELPTLQDRSSPDPDFTVRNSKIAKTQEVVTSKERLSMAKKIMKFRQQTVMQNNLKLVQSYSFEKRPAKLGTGMEISIAQKTLHLQQQVRHELLNGRELDSQLQGRQALQARQQLKNHKLKQTVQEREEEKQKLRQNIRHDQHLRMAQIRSLIQEAYQEQQDNSLVINDYKSEHGQFQHLRNDIAHLKETLLLNSKYSFLQQLNAELQALIKRKSIHQHKLTNKYNTLLELDQTISRFEQERDTILTRHHNITELNTRLKQQLQTLSEQHSSLEAQLQEGQQHHLLTLQQQGTADLQSQEQLLQELDQQIMATRQQQLDQEELQRKIQKVEQEDTHKEDQMHTISTRLSTQLSDMKASLKEYQEKDYQNLYKMRLREGEVLDREHSQLLIDRDKILFLQNLQEHNVKIIKNFKCLFCGHLLNKPATVIPCGHTYCVSCKDGYRRNKCHQCGPSKAVQAVYRNELLDEFFKVLDFGGLRLKDKLAEHQAADQSHQQTTPDPSLQQTTPDPSHQQSTPEL